LSGGLTGLRRVAEEKANRWGTKAGPRLTFRKAGDSAVVRFLEQGDDVKWAWFHELPKRQGQQWGDKEVCLNTKDDGTPCPGCERRLKRSVQGFINVIERDAIVWEEDADGKIKTNDNGEWIDSGRREDRVKYFRSGIKAFQELDGIDATYKGLMSRDFRITRKAGEFVEYSIHPVDPDGGPQPMSDRDRELEKQKADLAQLVTPRPYDQWGTGDSGDAGGVAPQQAGSVNPFLKPRSE